MAVAEPIRLTSLSHGAGCACKLGPGQLAVVMDLLGPSLPVDDVIVSESSGDDALLERAAICARHLVEQRVASPAGYRTWPTPTGS